MTTADDPGWLARLNTSNDPDRLLAELTACCAAPTWIAAILDGRPYADPEALFAASDRATADLDDNGLTAALAAHPRIGDRPGGEHASWSRQEQSGMDSADETLVARMADANRRYERRFDRAYLVCATGRSAEQLLADCEQRLRNDDSTERATVLGELAKIAQLRLTRLLHPSH